MKVNSTVATLFWVIDMSLLEVGLLDLNDQSRLLQYEQAMYRAFASTPIETDGVWTVDHAARRIATKIPYRNQIIIAADWHGELVSAVSVNMDMQNELQLEGLGFHIVREPGLAVEALSMFANKTIIGREILMARVARECGAILKEKGVKVLWATCEKKHYRAYVAVGFLKYEEVMFHGRELCLIRYAL
ncbi:hypothetical protein DKK66_17810 [Aquitalea sp. USM4]|nr:hypothetical protein DKK66_17810 [Aquitalea sp. USM4]